MPSLSRHARPPTRPPDLALRSSAATTSSRPPERAGAVVIGGGVTGASVARHLAKLGRQDVLLLDWPERHIDPDGACHDPGGERMRPARM